MAVVVYQKHLQYPDKIQFIKQFTFLDLQIQQSQEIQCSLLSLNTFFHWTKVFSNHKLNPFKISG